MFQRARLFVLAGAMGTLILAPAQTRAAGLPDEILPPVESIVPPGSSTVEVTRPSGDTNVHVLDNTYDPSEIEIAPGTTVTWMHHGDNPHSVTADDGSFDSNPNCSDAATAACMQNGQTFSETFDAEGEFPYHCRIHGSSGGGGMAGVVVVTAPEGPPGESEGGGDAGTPAGSTGGSSDELPATGTAPLIPLVVGAGFLGAGFAVLRYGRRL